jgi:hypothetical protein
MVNFIVGIKSFGITSVGHAVRLDQDVNELQDEVNLL